MLPRTMNTRVFLGSSAVVVALLALAALAPGASAYAFSSAQAWVADHFGWFYVVAVAGFLAFVSVLALSPAGRLRLGPDDAEPDFSWPSWLAMLFAAGMGIGLMYFAVAEPVQHYVSPPEAEPHTLHAAREAMVITFVHWGVHAWGVYALVGLSLAWFSHRKGLPLTLRSGLQPFLGAKVAGPLGDLVDIFAICGTLFGIATSLGLGVAQINTGLEYLVGFPDTRTSQVLLILAVMGMATVSVLTGLDRGIRRLSELNLVLAVGLMLFVLLAGPTSFLLKAFVQNVGLYLDHFFVRTFNLYAYEPRGWMANWTLFYWAWWIAWSPFVGMFIARISRGRTVREFVLGVLLVPAGFSFLWMTVFGNTAMALDMGQAAGAISAAVQADLSTAIFHFFEFLPWPAVTSTVAVLLVIVFFVTSADSGSLVIDTIASGGAEDTPTWQRVYWCALEGGAAAVLLVAGGLGALQAATLVAALPFTVIMILLAAGLWRSASADVGGRHAHAAELPLRTRLKYILVAPREADIVAEIDRVGEPALVAVRDALAAEGVAAEVAREPRGVALTAPGLVGVPGAPPFVYRLQARSRPLAAYSPLEAPEARRSVEWRLMASGEPGEKPYDVTGALRERLVGDVLEQLARWRAEHALPRSR